MRLRTVLLAALPSLVVLPVGRMGAAAEPEVLPEREKYLLLDSRVVEKAEGARLRVGTVAKHPANPLFGEELPWEHRYDNLYANVIRDEETGLYRCWYSPFIYYTPSVKAKWKAPPPPPGQPSHLMGVCYASSKDGLRWEKPLMEIAPFKGEKSNLVVVGPHGAGIFRDARDPDPARRFKMLFQIEKGRPGVAFSPEGLRWSEAIPCPSIAAAADTHNNAFWAPELGKYVGITRLFEGQRVVARTESPDFIHWTPAVGVLRGTPEEQTYAMPVFPHADVYLGLLMVFRTEEDRVHCELAWSPDTVRWERIDAGSPLIPNAPEKGAYDWGCAYAALAPVILPGEIRLYYGASDDTHYGKRKGYLALATLRPDGFAGYEAEGTEAPGVVLTRPVVASGELRVTADAKGGSLAVRALDQGGNVLAESEPVAADASDRPVQWKDPAGAAGLRGKAVRLRFELRGAKLYAFRFAAARGALSPVSFSEVEIRSDFWTARQDSNRRVSIPHNLDTCEATGRIRNFAQAAGLDTSPFQGHIFHDSDVYKVLEGVAYSLVTHPDASLEARLEKIIDLVAAAQQPDGYVNTWFTVAAPEKRWTNLPADHELYSAGHMVEAAVAHYRATGRRKFLDVACRFADHIDRTFGPGKRHGVPGHEEIELALVKLWRATGEGRYLDLARFFVEERGRKETHELYGEYCQDHLPVREQTEPVGHAVRFLYLFSAVADLAALDGDRGYVDAMERLWRNIVEKKMYITGGVGVQHHGEGFAREYFLPNHDAYCETCASIGMALWNHRLALLHGEGRFADLVERLLYNGALSGVSLRGDTFFYVNPLASRGGHHRQSWFGCACCPTNVVRSIAALGDYVYGALADGSGACVLQYVGGSGRIPLAEGAVRLRQETRYPWEGKVRIVVEPEGSYEFNLRVRIPLWCEGASLHLNGEKVDANATDGFVSLRRAWKRGDTVDLDLPMPVRRVASDPRVEENLGRLAIQRGPVVYCLEDVDHPCPVDEIALPADAELTPRFRPDLLGGVVALEGRGVASHIAETDDGGVAARSVPVDIVAVPYYAWDNRSAGRMVVWLPTEPAEPRKLEGATVAVVAKPSASHCNPADSAGALNDNVLPKSSGDLDIPRFTWWSHLGTKEWIAYEFEKPKTLSSAEVYWFDDTGRGSCRVPESWRLLWQDGSEWKPVEAAGSYGVEKDRFNRVGFEPVTTRALRIEAQLRPGTSGGILEWRLPR